VEESDGERIRRVMGPTVLAASVFTATLRDACQVEKPEEAERAIPRMKS
jgi:hypothetical protein